MSTTLRLNVPPLRQAPPAAVHLGEYFASAVAALSPTGSSTARPASRQAAQVRAMADQYQFSDPRLASELYAAADRHESLRND